MFSILIIATESKAVTNLCSGLKQNGFTYSVTADGKGITTQITRQKPDLVLVEVVSHLVNPGIRELCQKTKQTRQLPIIALVTGETLVDIVDHFDVDDFVISPFNLLELVLRINRLLQGSNDTNGSKLIKCDDLVIALAKCEVTVDGKIIELTFKEYQLLKFLASNRGRVHSRQALLNKVWDHDYYGGDRTIDVHIRRLRSKIEDSSHSFIETVRNIGYRFREDI